MTREEARAVYAQSGLTYSDMYDGLQVLLTGLQHEMDIASVNTGSLEMQVVESVKVRFKPKTREVTQFYIRVNGFYFKSREGISFNPDGFIGFAGWAADDNVAPILKGFIDAMELIKELKSGKNPERNLPATKVGSGCVHFGSKDIVDGPLKGLQYCESCGWVHVDGRDYFQLIKTEG